MLHLVDFYAGRGAGVHMDMKHDYYEDVRLFVSNASLFSITAFLIYSLLLLPFYLRLVFIIKGFSLNTGSDEPRWRLVPMVP
jgi:hypothetical protein